MLVNKGFEAGTVVTIKLTSGEEIIGKLLEDTATHYLLGRPLVLAMTAKGIEMVPYLFSVDNTTDIPLSKSTVTVIVPTAKEGADRYLELTTNIKLV